VPVPIGSILTPGIDLKKYSGLPFASTLCGSCSDVCPVKINIHEQLYKWRQIINEEGHLPFVKKQGMAVAGKLLSQPGWYKLAGKTAQWVSRWLPRPLVYNPLNTWGKARELPISPSTVKTEASMSKANIINAIKAAKPESRPLLKFLHYHL
jgi:L-lactate dehydrogenase complex protein LldF